MKPQFALAYTLCGIAALFWLVSAVAMWVGIGMDSVRLIRLGRRAMICSTLAVVASLAVQAWTAR